MVETGCEQCDYTGFLVREEGLREVAIPCACQRRARGTAAFHGLLFLPRVPLFPRGWFVA